MTVNPASHSVKQPSYFSLSAVLRVAGSLQKSTEVMKAMQSLVKIPEIQATMRELSKEMMKVTWRQPCVPFLAVTRSRWPGTRARSGQEQTDHCGQTAMILKTEEQLLTLVETT